MAAYMILNSGLDCDSITLLLQLELDDIQQLESQAKGKEPEGSPSDLQSALDDYRREIAMHLQREADRALALSISQALRLDTAAIGLHLEEEERAARDRAYALTLRDPQAEPPPTPPSAAAQLRSRPAVAPPSRALAAAGGASGALVVSGGASNALVVSGGASNALVLSRGASDALVLSGAPVCDCVVCGATSAPEGGIRSPCAHDYCRDCLVRLFELSLTDESIFPPRCCGSDIPLDISRKYIGPDLTGRFLARKLEMETPDRTYCHDARCSRFIPPGFIKLEVGTCVSCAKKTCTICKAASHQGECPDDPRTEQLLDLARKRGWKQCRACKAVVELVYGCYHITCRCNAQFCYQCGETWGKCRCPQ